MLHLHCSDCAVEVPLKVVFTSSTSRNFNKKTSVARWIYNEWNSEKFVAKLRDYSPILAGTRSHLCETADPENELERQHHDLREQLHAPTSVTSGNAPTILQILLTFPLLSLNHMLHPQPSLREGGSLAGNAGYDIRP